MILGLRTVIYHVSDLDKAKAWYACVFDVRLIGLIENPHFTPDQTFSAAAASNA